MCIFLEVESNAYILDKWNKYEGFKIRQGMGIRIHENGEFDEGYWENNVQHIKGRWIFKKGGCYEGEYNKHQRHGKGTYTYLSGARFIGHYKNDQRHGQGEEYDADGNLTKKGRWNDGHFQS